jgi:hypothetical protein
MQQVIFSKEGAPDHVAGPFVDVKLGLAEIFDAGSDGPAPVFIGKFHGNASHGSPLGIIVTDGITVTGADSLGTDVIGWVPTGQTTAYTDVNVRDYDG